MHKKSVRIKDEVVGKEFTTNTSGKCVIISYDDSRNVTVMFYKPLFVVKCRMVNLINGKVDNPFYPKHHNIGYMGVGKYTCNDREAYKCWEHMLKRAYDENFLNRHPTYKDVTVCEEWHNFQNFAEWCYSQKFFSAKDDKGKPYQLDKDLLIKGNKVYSSETCCFVPHRINSLLIGCDSRRGSLPKGVSHFKSRGNFVARCSVDGNPRKFLGYFSNPYDAFYAYKKAKESYIKNVVEEWNGKIDDKVYQALLNYEVHIDD